LTVVKATGTQAMLGDREALQAAGWWCSRGSWKGIRIVTQANSFAHYLARWQYRHAVSAFAPLILTAIAVLATFDAHAQTPPSSPPIEQVPRVIRLELPRAIQLALASSPYVGLAAAELEAARARMDQASADAYPMVHALGSFTELRREQRLFPATTPSDPAVITRHVAGADLAFVVPLYTGGRLSASSEAASHGESVASESSKRGRAEVAFEVTALFYAILAGRGVSTSLAASEAALVQHDQRLASLVQESKAAPLDRQRVQVRLATIRQQRIQADSDVEVRTLGLGSIIGLDGSATRVEVVGTLGAPPSSAIGSRDSLLRQASSRRSDLASAQADVSQQAAKVQSARAGRWPQVTLVGSYGARWGLAPSIHPAGTSALVDVGQVALIADIPLLDGGRVSASVREREALLVAARERLRKLQLRVRLEVETALAHLTSALARVEVSQATVGQARDAMQVESDKQAEGKSTITDVLDAQAALTEAEANRIRSLADVQIALAELRLASGEEP
jgi:outer membrane protein TolC